MHKCQEYETAWHWQESKDDLCTNVYIAQVYKSRQTLLSRPLSLAYSSLSLSRPVPDIEKSNTIANGRNCEDILAVHTLWLRDLAFHSVSPSLA